MLLPETPTTETEAVVPTTASAQRQNDWNAIANSTVLTADDLSKYRKPTNAFSLYGDDTNYNGMEHQSFGNAFIYGIDDTKQSNFITKVGAGLTEFARTGTDAAIELGLIGKDIRDTRREVRAMAEKIRYSDPETYRMLIDGVGEQRSTGKNILRLGASVGEGVLSVLPVGWAAKGGKALLAAKEATLLARVGEFGNIAKAMKYIGDVPILKHAATGFLYSAPLGFFSGLKENGDFGEGLKSGFTTGLLGAGLGAGGTALMQGMGLTLRGVKAAGGALREPMQTLKTSVGGLLSDNAKRNLNHLYQYALSQEGIMKKYYGEIGDSFVTMYKKANDIARKDLGALHIGFIDNGLMKPPATMGRFFKDVAYVGDDAALMSKYDEVLRGQGEFSNPEVQRAAIDADPKLKFLDEIRKRYGLEASRAGVTDNLLDVNTYLPKHTPVVPLDKKMVAQIEAAGDDATRQALYASNDPVVQEMVENSVYKLGKFTNLNDAYKAYYDYADIVANGGRVKKEANSFLQKMVADGEATSIDDALGKVVADMKYRKSTLTPQAGSLDFNRKVNLPWYDPNPARVLPVYSADAAMRLNVAKQFGADDEVIKNMIGKISNDPNRGIHAIEDAKNFEKVVRTIMGTLQKSPEAERVSQFLRLLQIPKLAFGQIVNVGQNLNYLLSTDLKSTVFGLQQAFRSAGARKAIESGSLVNGFLRDSLQFSGQSAKAAEKFLNWTGFTATENFNRSVGASVAERYALSEFDKLLKSRGLAGATQEEKKNILKMMVDKGAFEKGIGEEGYKIQQKLADEWKAAYPNEKFDLRAGSLGKAQEQLDTMSGSYQDKIGKLQKAKDTLEDDLLAESKPMTEAYVSDLKTSIDAFKSEIARLGGGAEASAAAEAVASLPASQSAVDDALEAAIKLRRSKMQSILERLEERYDEARAVGMGDDIPVPKSTAKVAEQDLGTRVAEIHSDIKALDEEILRLTNEQAKKESILSGVVDSYKIAETNLRTANPGVDSYDQLVKSRQGEMKANGTGNYDPRDPQVMRLKELGVDVDSALARGFLTREDLLEAGSKLVEQTQFLSRPIDLPGFMSSPWGKVFSQYKSFAYQQVKYIGRILKNDLAENGVKSKFMRDLLIMGTVFPMTGEVLGDIRSLVTNEKRPTEFLDRYLSDLTSAGVYGLVADSMRAAQQGDLGDFVLGPTFSDISKYAQNILTANGSGLAKQSISQLGFTRPLVNTVFPSKGKGKESIYETVGGWMGH